MEAFGGSRRQGGNDERDTSRFSVWDLDPGSRLDSAGDFLD
jgi:hypothetical protein